MHGLRDFLSLDREKGIIHIEETLNPMYEIPALLKALDGGDPVLFEAVEGYSVKVLAGVCGSRENICAALGVGVTELTERLSDAIHNPVPCFVADETMKALVDRRVNLRDIPILTHYDRDQGPYITSAIVHAKSLDGTKENVSFHRFNVLDEKTMSIRIQTGHLSRLMDEAREAGEEHIDVAISVGLHPAVMLAGASHAPYGISEFDVANNLLGGDLSLFECPHVDAKAPTDAELVIEGKISLYEKAIEGPYVCVTGTWKEAGPQPLVEVAGIMHREDYVYQALLPASREHKLLEGIPNEVRVWDNVRKVAPEVKGVNMTLAGCSWLHAVVSFKKTSQQDPEKVIRATFEAIPAIKHAVAVDSDISPYDLGQVEWSIATRFQGDKNVIIIPNAYASGLDPSSDTENKLGCKVGFDATRPLSKSGEDFRMGEIPSSDRVRKVITGRKRVHES